MSAANRTLLARWEIAQCGVGALLVVVASVRLVWPTLSLSRSSCEIGLVLGAALVAVGVHRLMRGGALAWTASALVLAPLVGYFIWSLRADAAFERDQKLLRAVARGSTVEVQSLLVEGADPNVEHDGVRALTLAALSGDRRIVELLLNAGADVNHTGEAGPTPLMAASGQADIAELLVKHGASR